MGGKASEQIKNGQTVVKTMEELEAMELGYNYFCRRFLGGICLLAVAGFTKKPIEYPSILCYTF